jgi:DNA-binding Lrp family transcriptional regulator
MRIHELLALAPWKAKALGKFPPSFVKQHFLNALDLIVERFQNLKKESIRQSAVIRAIEKELDNPAVFFDDKGPVPLYSQKEVFAIRKALPQVFEKLVDAGLVRRDGDSISLIEYDKIEELVSLLRHISRSKERMLKWTCYYCFANGKATFKTKDILAHIPELEGKIEEKLDALFKKCAVLGLNSAKKKDQYTINHVISDRIVADALISDIELLSRWTTVGLEYDILRILDVSPQSNSDLAKILDVDKATISRTIRRLVKEEEAIKPAKHFGSYGKQYWITNCQMCPWQYTKESCRKESIETLQTIFRERYGLELDDSSFQDIEHNQSLMHLKEVFSEMPEQNYIEIEKRSVLIKLLRKLISKIGAENIVIRNSEYWIKDKDNERIKSLDLPFPYLLNNNQLKEK